MTTETVDLTPTWRGILPALLAIFEHGDRQTALDELAKMANLADRYNQLTSKVEYVSRRGDDRQLTIREYWEMWEMEEDGLDK